MVGYPSINFSMLDSGLPYGMVGWGCRQYISPLLMGAIFYSFQIYSDFSGYCDIGIGAAKVMGIRLMENFDEPYLSSSISQFWGRWHISLSTWFRDYV
jgi:D-alanyl-lipoteichoic acid acyltransferase DltB (MBOAT superfamily)